MGMWLNELLLVVMAFLVVLILVLAALVSRAMGTRPKEVEVEQVEKVLVEYGFEGEGGGVGLESSEVDLGKPVEELGGPGGEAFLVEPAVDEADTLEQPQAEPPSSTLIQPDSEDQGQESPEVVIDLGVIKCPYCGSSVPRTMFCINCGKELKQE